MSFLSNSALYLRILYFFGLCPFAINRQTNKIHISHRHTTIYSIVFAAILTLSTLYFYEFYDDFLVRPKATPTSIVFISQSIHLYSVVISCTIIIANSIFECHKYIEIYTKISNLDIQLIENNLQNPSINYKFIQTIIVPFIAFTGYALFANYMWIHKVTKVIIGFIIVYAIETSTMVLSVLHIRHLIVELLMQYKKIKTNAETYLRNNLLINKENYQKFVIIIELLDTFDSIKILLNQTIGWPLIVNYVSDFIVITVSIFVTLTFDVNDINKRERIHFLIMFLLYTLPYAVKTLSAVKIIDEIGINQVSN